MKYDGFDFNPYLLISDIGRPLLPPQNITDKPIFGRSGTFFLTKEHEPIEIPVAVSFHEDAELTFREKTRLIAGNLNKSEPKKLIFDDEPNVYIKGIIADSTDIENLIKAGETVLNFYCPDPYYYEIDDEVFTFNGTGEHNFTRKEGNEYSEPTIEITGSNSAGEIIVESDNTKITFDGKLQAGETLVLDTPFVTSFIRKSSADKESANNDIDTMVFPILEVGANRLKVTTTGNATVDEIKVYAHSRWV